AMSIWSKRWGRRCIVVYEAADGQVEVLYDEGVDYRAMFRWLLETPQADVTSRSVDEIEPPKEDA
ncbi:MAG TPA: hypothetical protein VK425_03960, partial [Acidimicrobiales bacterium]|nr:hypothetical protein [Acidimicrobiales bacterium]